jgi:hypothetical protein
MKVGYAYVIEQLRLRLLPLATPAAIRSVTRIERRDTEIAVPAKRAPGPRVIDHLLFALKHEGTELQVLSAACPHLTPQELVTELRASPAGLYIRKLCAVWEQFTGRSLADLPEGIAGTAAPLFDPEIYVTSEGVRRDKRWGVIFNGLGDWSFCPTVRRTAELTALLEADTLGQLQQFLKEVPRLQLDRAISWAYLDETRSSFAIEGESPPGNKAETFATLLRKAHERCALTEEHWVELQNAIVTNPLAREVSYRTGQNHLSDGTYGARSVSYLPPAPDLVSSLMRGIAKVANGENAGAVNPLVRAALASFGFVFTHPFADGNGRLSRYLAHYSLCQSGALPHGSILPLSAAMKRNEFTYLAALQSFSIPARALWQVRWIDGEDFNFKFEGDAGIYRFFDATACVTFFCEMAQEALRHDLREEVNFLALYDEAVRQINARYDIEGSVLSRLIRMTYQNQGIVSKNRRKQFALQVQPEAFDFIESYLTRALAGQQPS